MQSLTDTTGCSRCLARGYVQQQQARQPLAWARTPARLVRQRTTLRAAAQDEGFGESMKRVAKQMQGALPIIGLISRLTTPTGGVGLDDLSYPDFCRAVYEAALEPLNIACVDLERKYGKQGCGMRNVFYALWASRDVGLVEPKAIVASVRRLRVTQDMEIECDRHEGGKQQTLQKYSLMDKPRGNALERAQVAVDAIATLMGIPDGKPLDAEDAEMVAAIVKEGIFFDASEAEKAVAADAIQRALDTRGERTYVL